MQLGLGTAALGRPQYINVCTKTCDNSDLMEFRNQNFAVLKQLAFLKKEHNLKIGLTTTGTNQVEVIKKALNVLVDGEPVFDLFQVTYNFLDQSLIEISDELQSQNKSIVIKEALVNGRVFKNENYAHYTEMYATLESLSKKYNVGIDAISLKYCAQTIPESRFKWCEFY